MDYLYQETSALLFPTEYEGLGMPILEALEKDKPVACSNISVFREMSEQAFVYFDPKNIDSIAVGLQQAIELEVSKHHQEYQDILDRYSWGRSSRKSFRGNQGKYAYNCIKRGHRHYSYLWACTR